MKRQPGGDMLIFGSGSVVGALTEHGLIDEYQIVVNPVLLGGGRSWLSGVPRQVKLQLVEAHPLETSGNVRLRYKLAT